MRVISGKYKDSPSDELLCAALVGQRLLAHNFGACDFTVVAAQSNRTGVGDVCLTSDRVAVGWSDRERRGAGEGGAHRIVGPKLNDAYSLQAEVILLAVVHHAKPRPGTRRLHDFAHL